MSTITSNLQAVRQQIQHAAQLAGRETAEITLLAVSKTMDVHAVLDAAAAGQRAFGENYLQEALDKIAAARTLAPQMVLEWHFIGPVQSNKTRQIAEHFDWVHGVERLKIAQRLSEQRPPHLPKLNLCLQINISGEASKSGIPIDQAAELAQQIVSLPNITLRGLMVIPAPLPEGATLEQQRAPFHQIKQLQQQLNQQLSKQPSEQPGEQSQTLDTLSMGMSADLQAAIMEGSTIVRIGTAIFGKRNYAN